MSVELSAADILRKPFKAEEIGKLPRVTCPKCSDRNCQEHEKRKCNICQAYVSERHIHIDYVGHADVTSRLLQADPAWNWEPVASDDHGMPVFDTDSKGNPVGLWIRLTVAGVTRLGYGSAPSNQPDAVKVLIGDALRNAAMRFGVALDLWAKGDRADPTAENATASAGQAPRGGRQQARPDASNGNGQAVKAEQPPPPASRDEVDEQAQPFAEEASQCRTVKALSDVNVRAREARKLSALIRNPATGGTGGLGQYIAWLRHQLEDTDAALKQLTDAAASAGIEVSELDAKVLEITGAGIEAATAAQLRQAAEGLAKVAAAA